MLSLPANGVIDKPNRAERQTVPKIYPVSSRAWKGKKDFNTPC